MSLEMVGDHLATSSKVVGGEHLKTRQATRAISVKQHKFLATNVIMQLLSACSN